MFRRLLSTLLFAMLAIAISASQLDDIFARHSTLPNGQRLTAQSVLILVSLDREQMLVRLPSGQVKSYRVSTAKNGAGSREGSLQTPLGWHQVTEWIGQNATPGQVFQSRQPIAKIIPETEWQSTAKEDYVLTRIMWLTGLEAGQNLGGNVDSHNRCIYIHGTNQEHLLGTYASHGCIRLANYDVIELFNLTIGKTTYIRIINDF